ncbi:hypothetical protein [Ascidiaceihabitans sp.]|uniref:hypothetical protein n=1 Tax=Ascidiaceihabitans sp. TaxID=1872644 RepID=UPI003296C031
MALKPIRLTRIDETHRDSHTRLCADDHCLFLYEKTSGRDYTFSKSNNLISNLKKPVTSNANVLSYKRNAISKCAADLRASLRPEWLRIATLVPIPPSKAPSDPAYDNRMEQVCRLIVDGQDVRNLVIQNTTMVANHARGTADRVTVEELLAVYSIDESLANPAPNVIGIVDDMLTAGTHYRAMHTVLSDRFPDATIIGIFVARRIFPDD